MSLRGFAPDDKKGAQPRISAVREAALRDTALVLGVQWGLGDRSRELVALMESKAVELDQRFGFGRLFLGAGFLPPVINEARDAMAIDGQVLRIAKRIYRVAEPPRPVATAPTWRDWLYMGLDAELRPRAPEHIALLPRDELEATFWRGALALGYAEGRKQAQEAFDINLARLRATHEGMERYYDLFKRGVVSAPVIAQADSIADRSDPNTFIIGNTVIRVTIPMEFVADPNKWVPLAQ